MDECRRLIEKRYGSRRENSRNDEEKQEPSRTILRLLVGTVNNEGDDVCVGLHIVH